MKAFYILYDCSIRPPVKRSTDTYNAKRTHAVLHFMHLTAFTSVHVSVVENSEILCPWRLSRSVFLESRVVEVFGQCDVKWCIAGSDCDGDYFG